jgi:hypothetical protein
VSCADLEKAIDAEWWAQQANIDRVPADTEIGRLDTELADLWRQVDAGRADLVAQHNALKRGALANVSTLESRNPLGTEERPDGDHRLASPLL